MIIPIVFSFDKNLVFPAAVSICSLMMSAKPNTIYDVIILYGGNDIPRIQDEKKILQAFPNLKIQYRSVGDAFQKAYEVRNITTPTYYRLLIPNIVPEYDRVIYADVDIIFRLDLSDIYKIDLQENYLGAVYAMEKSLSSEGQKYAEHILGISPGEYFQAGFLLMNLKQMRKDSKCEDFNRLVPRGFKYQDQDILNISCEKRILSLPWNYNMGTASYIRLETCYNTIGDKYANTSIEVARDISNIHYNGAKPWKEFCLNFDIWWEFYRKSPIFDPKVYFSFFYNKLEEYDQLPLIKRLKILFRYFTVGQKKTKYKF